MNRIGSEKMNLNDRLKAETEARRKEMEAVFQSERNMLEKNLKQISHDALRTIERDINAQMNALVASVEPQKARLNETLTEIEERPWWTLKTTVTISAVTAATLALVFVLVTWMIVRNYEISRTETQIAYRQMQREMAEMEAQVDRLWGITPLPMLAGAQMIALPPGAQIRQRCREAGRICVRLPE